MKLPDKVYDILKWVCLIVLPACATLYSVMSGIWGFPYGEQIVGTITAVGAFLGTLIGVSAKTISDEKKYEYEDAKNGD